MKKLLVSCACIALVGCVGTKQGQINPANVGPVLSQINDTVDIKANTVYGTLTVHKSTPGAADWHPIVPLTTAQSNSIAIDPAASFAVGFAGVTGSFNATWQGLGGTLQIERSMPPATNGPLEVVVVNTSTNPVPSVVSTNLPTK